MLDGACHPDFQAVADLFASTLPAGGGGAVSVYHRGEPVVDLWGGLADVETGRRWAEDTLAMSFSTTKGVTATILHMCVDRGFLDYDDRVADHWPEFAANGKEAITVRQVLCHESGLFDVQALLGGEPERALDWEVMVDALAVAHPRFEPGTANAYQAVTFGFLVGELVRRVTGRSLGTVVAEELVPALGLDGCYIGTPDAAFGRVAPVIPPETAVHDLTSSQISNIAELLGYEIHPEYIAAALGSVQLAGLLNTEDLLRAELPAFNGTFTARALARMYACLAAGGELDDVRLISQATIARAIEIQNTRPDLVIVFPMNWRLGYHGVLTTAGVPERAFGHNGLGGSGAWADPDRQLGFAFTTTLLGNALAGDDRVFGLGGAAIQCADAR